jgi:hypothetical protein
MRVIPLILQVVVAQLLLSSTVLAQAGLGQFKGEVIAKFLRDGRNMRLEQPFGYVDPKGQAWDVPAGTETDGASIPRVLWVTHPPFTGKYRAAAVVHDYYCQTKSRGWKATHEVFYHAMRAAGVEDKTAKVMYAAVYYFGPRWGRGGAGEARATGAVQELPFEDQARLFDQLRSWIESESPDIEGIARRIDAGNLSTPSSEARVALAIGNSAYKYTPALENPTNDAGDISVALEKLGFQVITGIDLDKSGMERAIRQFAQSLGKSKVGLFFYAGHGLQVSGRNYLVPVDAKLDDASGLDFELIRLDLVQRTMERETKTNIVFLDACRDNPLARNLARSMGTRSTEIGRGLAAVESGVGTLISFSTQPGNVALDGKGRNSPFAGALVQQLLAGRGDLADMLISVRRSVMQATANRQVPWEHSSLTDRFYFTAPSAAAARAGLSYAEQAELAFWNAVKDSKQPAVVRSYLEAYPDGAFVVVAKAIIDDLERKHGAAGKAASSAIVTNLGPATGPGAGPFDGRWRVIRASPSCRASPKADFVIVIRNSRMQSYQGFGQVEADGKFEFKVDAKDRPSLGVYSGRLSGNSGEAEHKGGWNGSSFNCGGQATLTKVDDAVAADPAPNSAEGLEGKHGAAGKAASNVTATNLGPTTGLGAGPFDGRWRVVFEMTSCRSGPRGEYVILIRNNQIQSGGGQYALEGRVEADGRIDFRRDGKVGTSKDGILNVISGRLVGNTGRGEQKGGWTGERFTCGGQATLTKLDVATDPANADAPLRDLPDDPKLLAEVLQKELQRVGCYAGTVDGQWGLGSRAAMTNFNLFTRMALPTDQPDQKAAAIVQKTLTRVCPDAGKGAQKVQGSGPVSRSANSDRPNPLDYSQTIWPPNSKKLNDTFSAQTPYGRLSCRTGNRANSRECSWE